MKGQNCHCNNSYRGRLAASRELLGTTDPLAVQHAASWRAALVRLASPAIRLHRLRNLRAQIVHEALGDRDDCADA